MNTANNLWMAPPENLGLEDNDVHIWKVDLNVPGSHIQKLQEVLSADEIKRARRFYFQKDRNAFTVARGALRNILSWYLNFQPDELVFEYNSYGKPSLVTRFNTKNLQFNLSHSHQLALVAVIWNHEVGVDVEWMREDLADLQIAGRFFSQAEVVELRTVPVAKQKTAFFNCWTRKEAFIKAKGKGLSIPLDQFDVSLKPGVPAALLRTRFLLNEASHWAIYDVSPEPGYRAALAIPTKQKHIKYWQFATSSAG